MVDAMEIVIRTDASSDIGTGHVVRCLCLADALQARGARVAFVCRSLTAGLELRLENAGHQVHMIDAGGSPDELAHAGWLGGSQDHDAAATATALQAKRPDWIVVDHYALDERWERTLRPETGRILVIDDLADRRHDCDLLLDSNLGDAGRYGALLAPQVPQLLGPRHALLRPEFAIAREAVRARDAGVRRLLVFFGGVDQHNQTGRVLGLLPGVLRQDVAVDVVIGHAHPRRDAVLELSRSAGYTCHVQTGRMAELMAAADLAVGAGGTTTWERCCVGLPAVIWPQARNQVAQVEAAAALGVALAPDRVAQDDDALAMQLRAVLDNPHLLAAVSTAGRSEVDGLGAARVCRAMGVTGLRMRRATPGDSADLHEWRNAPQVRLVSRNSDPIARGDHERWLADTLSRSDRWLLIGERQGKAVGVARFDRSGTQAEVSIYVTPHPHPPGTGADLLAAAQAWLQQNGPGDITVLCADVLADNEASHQLFQSAGFQRLSCSYLKRISPHG